MHVFYPKDTVYASKSLSREDVAGIKGLKWRSIGSKKSLGASINHAGSESRPKP